MSRGRIKRLISWSGLLFGLIFLTVGLIQLTVRPHPEAALSTNQPLIADGDKGEKATPITLIEYSDFQCPACAYSARMVKRLKEELGNSFQVVYRHFPLKSIHPNAEFAARSAEAADRQGKFWEMHHLLFEKQSEWAEKEKEEAEKIFAQYATELHLNVEQFQRDVHSQEVTDKVSNDYQSGLSLGVNATPTFFLNSHEITSTPQSYDEFKELLEDYLRRSKP